MAASTSARTISNLVSGQGDGGADLLLGEAGNDAIYGGTGNDTIYADEGDRTDTSRFEGSLRLVQQQHGPMDVVPQFDAPSGRSVVHGYLDDGAEPTFGVTGTVPLIAADFWFRAISAVD